MASMAGSGLSLGTLWIEINARANEAIKVIEDFGAASDKFVQETEKKWRGLENVGEGFLKIGAGLTGALTVPLTGLSVAAVSAAEGINTARVAFTTMLGSGQKADKLLRDLQAFAATTPFEFTDLVSAAQRMKTLGFSAEQIIPTLRTIGDTVAASGTMSKESINGITTALGQMQLKGKVSAEEMTQLSERGVDAWGALAKAAGVTVPEAMKLAEKGAFDAAQVVPAILAGMAAKAGGSMEAMSKTLTGQWSNFKDTITQALIPIGQALIPALQSLLPILTNVLGKVAEGAKWFSQLPDPIKNAALAIAGIAAAIGPVIAGIGAALVAFASLQGALAGMGLSIGVVVTAIGPWVLAIGAVVAALVALGTWIYANWDTVVAVLTQAWEGLTELWTATWEGIKAVLLDVWQRIWNDVKVIWEPLRDFVLYLWNGTKEYWIGVWNSTAKELQAIWNGIKTIAADLWNSLTKDIQIFINYAKKIPGVAKLMSLDEAAASVTKMGAATKELNTEVKAVAPPLKKVTVAIHQKAKAAKKATEHLKPVKLELKELTWALQEEKAKAEAAHREFVEWNKTHATAESQIPKVTEVSEELNQAIIRVIDSAKLVPPAFGDAEAQAFASMKAAGDAVTKVDEAYKTLGITSTATLNEQARKATEAYETIKTNAGSRVTDIERAWVAMEEARIAAAKGAGETITAARQKELDDMKTKLDTELPKQKDRWTEFGTEVSTIVTNTAQSIAKSFFDGNLSWGEKMKGMLKSLGEAAMSMFVTPITDAVGKLIAGAFADLLGGKGLGGMFDSLKNIGSMITDVFGGASDVAGKVGGAATTAAGGAANAAGAAGKAVGAGLSGVVGAVSGVVSAVSGVISNFQMAKMETSLNAIEHNTRYSMMFLGEQGDRGILGRLIELVDYIQWVPASLLEIRGSVDRVGDSLGRMEPMFLASSDLLRDIFDLDRDIAAEQRIQTDRMIEAIWAGNDRLDRLALIGTKQVEIQTYGSDPTIVAAKLAAQLRAQGGFA